MRVAALFAGGLILLLAAAQLILPHVAASRISSKLARYGHVDHVSVSAFPAVTLLWGHADSASVQAGRLSLSPAQAAQLLWEGRGVDHLDLQASAVKVGPLQMSSATLRKRGGSLAASGRASQGQVAAALPPGMTVQLLGSSGGRVRVRAGGALFGVGGGSGSRGRSKRREPDRPSRRELAGARSPDPVL